MAIDRFGEIPIMTDPDETEPAREKIEAGSEPDGRDVPGRRQQPAAPDRGRADREAVARRSGRHGRAEKKREPFNFRIVRWLLAPLFIVLLYGVGSYFFVPALIKGPMAGMLSERLERPVEVKRIVFAPFSLDLYLDEITVGAVQGDTGRSGLLLACEKIRCRLGLERIFQGQLICNRITLEQLNLQIRRNAAGFNDLFDVLNIFSLQVNREIESVWPSWLDAGELGVRNGTIVFHDDLIGRQYQVEQVELYLPPSGPGKDGSERLPKISAVINASPVQAEAVRTLNKEGKAETSLALHIKDVMLSSYLEYFPQQDQLYRLTDGRADIDLKIVFPRETDSGGRFVFSGEASVSAVKVVDAETRPVFVAPQASFAFEFVPAARELLFRNIVISEPELTVDRDKKKSGEKNVSPAGRFFDVFESLLLSPGRFRVEQLRSTNGTMRFSSQGSSTPATTWSEVDFTLEGPAPGVEGKDLGPASFSFRATDRHDGNETLLSAEGRILPGGGINGRFSAKRLDFRRYRDFLPGAGLRLDQGVGDISFVYDIKTAGEKGPARSDAAMQLREGKVDVAQFVVSDGKKKVAAGKNLRCDNFQTDGSARPFTCNTLTLTDSEIFSPPPLTVQPDLSPGKEKERQLVVTHLRVSGSKLHAPLLAPLCASAGDLVVENFSLQADNLQAADGGKDNITASASLGSRGEVKVAGGYSLVDRRGNLQISLRQIDLTLLNPCLSPSFVPPVKQGTFHVEGNVSLPAVEFIGQAWINDMAAGEGGGPRVNWQLASSDKVVLQASPYHLDLGEIMIRKPSVAAGLTDTEGTLRKFFPPGKPSFAQATIEKICIEDGRFTLPWPIILPGYQPELTDIDGEIASLGEDAMPFSFKGKINGIGGFAIDGMAEAEKVRSYSLEMTDVRLDPFDDFFRNEVGLATSDARASWRQTMNRTGIQSEVSTSLGIRGGQPETDSPFLQLLTMLIDENSQLQMTMNEKLPVGEEHSFLLHLLQRQLRHQSVRADISRQLVLKEHFPVLELPDYISFAPGSFTLEDPEGLSGYRELLGKRPFLRLRLQPSVNEELDAAALQAALQREADLKREEENRGRALEKMKREEREIQRLAAIREGKGTVETEEIDPEELARDLEPLPYVRVEVPAAMVRELGKNRALAVHDYLVNQLSVEPDRIIIADRDGKGDPLVKIFLEPYIPGGKGERAENADR